MTHQPPHNLLLTNQLIKQLQLALEECYRKAERFFNCNFKRPQVQFDLKGYNAGTATPQKNLLRFNAELFVNNQQHFLQQTVPHEVAHLVAYQLYGLAIKPHGKEWQQIMRQVYQLPAERCHHYQVARKQTTYYRYQCPCDAEHLLTIRRHNSIKKGVKYICKKCKGVLSYTNNIAHQ